MQNAKVKEIFGDVSIRTTSISAQISGIIRQKIIDGELLPGEMLNEMELSGVLGVSKASVREALVILNKEGLVEKKSNKCAQVVQFSVEDVKEIFALRIAIEKMCAEICIKNNTAPLQQLQRQIDIIDKLAADVTIHYADYAEQDILFHEMLILAANNGRAIQVWKDLKNQFKMLFFSQLKHYPDSVNPKSDSSHNVIVSLLEQGNVGEVQKIIAIHIEGAMLYALRDPSFRKDSEQ